MVVDLMDADNDLRSVLHAAPQAPLRQSGEATLAESVESHSEVKLT